MARDNSQKHRVCPWWLGFFLISPLRRWTFHPAAILAPYIREGMTVLEPGPGMGFFTLEMARLVGANGHVIAVDVQAKMLDRLERRARKAGVAERIEARLTSPDSMALASSAGSVDFALAFAVVHEMPSAGRFFAETHDALKPGARLLFAEPSGHVTDADFEKELDAAVKAGFRVVERPQIRRSHAALLENNVSR
jgi:ubiquinone/menaquinone biosynthesis C-methylase UbiE